MLRSLIITSRPIFHLLTLPAALRQYSSSAWNNRKSEQITTHVWWDIENCRIPIGVNSYKVTNRIKSALRSNGIDGPVMIRAHGDMLQFNQETCLTPLIKTGVYLKHVPNCGKNSADRSILDGLDDYVVRNSPPAHIFMISGDGDFANILHRLKKNDYNVLLACGSSNCSAALRSAAAICWDWNELVRGRQTELVDVH
ncbi:hypothetical protein ZOSMA_75G00060 [Zostera marina]|uniref:NYN domain-containing protein n=1 Tax=Zostera marina TaxID=29655 RepID=A0A0K9NPN6_ZOSMR|nr:hypothetical protein ZOSMA_75G00060 [Zostera marina]